MDPVRRPFWSGGHRHPPTRIRSPHPVTTRDAFLATIRAHPDDDLPRLVMADWLDEQGECERAADMVMGTSPEQTDELANTLATVNNWLGPFNHI
jgi:uncharacterized protein (TIGR02996 family)